MAGKNDLYADEIASAKRLLAEKAYNEQPWSEWAGDVVGNAVNTARSILPTALGGKGEVGISDMARGAYEGVKDAVTFPGDVLTGKQALYDEAGRPLEQAVGRSFNTAATMGGASSVVPVPDNSLRIFGGVRSKTANMDALTKAQIMEREGASSDDIWRDTGWGRGADTQWRYEIPDYKAVIRPYNFKNPVTGAGGTSYNQAVFSELLDHPEFFEAYPELKDIKVNETFSPDVRGYYMPRFERGTINPSISEPYIALNLKALPSDANKLSTLLHEAQHAVQQKEGFAPGSSPKNYPAQTPNRMVAVYDKAFLNDPDLKFISSVRDTPEYQEAIAASNKLYDEQIKPRWKKLIEDEDNGIDRTGEYTKLSNEAEKLTNEAFPILKKVDDAYKSLTKKGIPHKRPKEFLEPTEAYRATAGEVEARNVQERMNMVPIGLRELPPWKTQESYHPYEGQIIDWNDTSWRKGYSGRGRVAKSIVDQALELVIGGGNDAAKKAFANTRLKTPQGDPMRLYHMTPEDIFEFRASPENRSGPAVFLSPYPDFQPAYHQSAERGPSGELTSQFKEGANVMPVYADVRNPLVLDHPRKIKEAAAKYQGGDREFPRYVSPEAKAAMEADGYDAIIFGGENPIPYGDRPMDARLGFQEARDEEIIIFDPKRIKSATGNRGTYDTSDPDITKAFGGALADEDDIDNALRIARATGGRAGYAGAGSVPVMMEDAKGNKYDAQGNIIPPQNPGPNPDRSDATPQSVAAKAVNDPATYDALMERYAVPDRDIAEYEALKATVGQQPQDIRQMTHVGDRPRREVAVDMPLFGGEYSMGTAPYDVASGMQGAAQTAYDLKTAPFYFNPITAPIAAGMDLAEGIATNDPLTASLAVGFGPGGKYAKAAGIGAVNYFMDPAEAQAGPERWFSKLYRSAEALPMEKMTGEQALAMLRKTAPQEEIKWTGLEGFASENPVTTKKALLDFLKRNQVQTQDVVLGGPKADVPAEIKEKWAALVDRKNEIVNQIVLPPNERTRPWDELMAEQESVMREMDEVNEQANKFLNGYTPTRYGPGSQFGEKYMTPGGENYQETLITLPARDIYTPYIGALRDEAYNSAYKEAIASGIAEDKAADFAEKLIGKMQPYQHARIVNKTKELNEITLKQEMLDKAVYKSQHWDEKNVIGHIRSQMLTANPPGANRPLKLFNVDENQSDLGQAGRKQGFVTIEDRMNYPNMGKQYDAMNAQRRKLETLVRYGDDANPEVQVASGQLAELDRQMQALSDKMASIRGGGVPAAPYVTSTQGWTDFSIKKALDQAIDSGADYFTFTPGEVQAKRYSLRNEVQGLAYDPEEKTLSFYPKDGRGWQDVSETIPPEDLKKYIGEEASKKLLAQEPNSLSGNQILEGIDLEFGGEGMIDYYNNIYKKRVEKVVKDLTGKKIQWEVLPAETSEGIVPRLGFRIDDDLREAKFPTFASGGVVNKALQLTRDY